MKLNSLQVGDKVVISVDCIGEVKCFCKHPLHEQRKFFPAGTIGNVAAIKVPMVFRNSYFLCVDIHTEDNHIYCTRLTYKEVKKCSHVEK